MQHCIKALQYFHYLITMSAFNDTDEFNSPPVYEGSTDLMAMDINEASKYLFGQVNWQEYIRAGVFLSQNEVLFYI